MWVSRTSLSDLESLDVFRYLKRAQRVGEESAGESREENSYFSFSSLLLPSTPLFSPLSVSYSVNIETYYFSFPPTPEAVKRHIKRVVKDCLCFPSDYTWCEWLWKLIQCIVTRTFNVKKLPMFQDTSKCYHLYFVYWALGIHRCYKSMFFSIKFLSPILTILTNKIKWD